MEEKQEDETNIPATTSVTDVPDSKATVSEVGEPTESVDQSEPAESRQQDEPEHAAGEGIPDHEEVGGEGAEAYGDEWGEWEWEYETVAGEFATGEHEEEEKKKRVRKRVRSKSASTKGKDKEIEGEGEMMNEQLQGEQVGVKEEYVEEEQYVGELPPDPAAPFNFSDSSEALKPKFVLRQDQLVEVEKLWEYYLNYTPAFTDLDNYITEKELVYMLKCLNLETYTEEQYYELVEYCVRPTHPKGHIFYDQFLKMVTIRTRDTPIEDELRKALNTLDPEATGMVDREFLRELLTTRGQKMPQKNADNLIKEVDMTNDGTIGVEDVIGTMCIDLNRDDIEMLQSQLNPPEDTEDDF